MKSYRNLSEFLKATNQTRNDIMAGILDAVLVLLLSLDDDGRLEIRDIMKISEPLHTLYMIVNEVNEDIQK